MKKALLDALEKKYEAEIAQADATVHIYFNNSVGIGEHPQHIEELDKLVSKIADAEDKLKILKEFQQWQNYVLKVKPQQKENSKCTLVLMLICGHLNIVRVKLEEEKLKREDNVITKMDTTKMG